MQVRAFAKEDACCARYEAAQDKVKDWGLRSAVAGSVFFAFNYLFATGALVVVLWCVYYLPSNNSNSLQIQI